MQQSTFFRGQALVDVGDFNPDNHIWWDGELLLDLSLAGKQIVVVDEFWSLFTIQDWSISGQRGKRHREIAQVRSYTATHVCPGSSRCVVGYICRPRNWGRFTNYGEYVYEEP